jgi:hypothetical protein
MADERVDRYDRIEHVTAVSQDPVAEPTRAREHNKE